MKSIELIELPQSPYLEVLDLQHRLFDIQTERKRTATTPEQAQATEDTLILCSHDPVYTLGRSGDQANMLLGEQALRQMGASLVHIDRGGDITFHGPGQLVGYPIIDLQRSGWGVRRYIELIEQSIIELVAQYGIQAGRLEGATGVWIDGNTPRARKICAIGVRVSRGITMHGFALNVCTDLRYFTAINPCGFTDKGVTSISREVGREIDLAEVMELYKFHFERILEYKIKNRSYVIGEEMGNQASG